jgi:transposase InsO family protein
LKLKKLRTDNGLEYCSNEFEKYLEDKGVIHEKTVPYTPQQNGVAERWNQTLWRITRSLIKQANLPIKFWPEAMNTACYLSNIVKDSKGRIPYEIWTKRKVNLDSLCPSAKGTAQEVGR